MRGRILVTDDDELICHFFTTLLTAEGYQVTQALTGEEALIRLQEQPYDLLLVDVWMPGMSGLDVVRAVRPQYPDLPVVVMSGSASIETTIEAIHQGAFDYVSKPVNPEELLETVSRALAQRALHDQAKKKAKDSQGTQTTGMIIGRSPAMVNVYKSVARVAPTKSTVLIVGQSGTGKELIARAIHQHSPRARHPFVAVDCGALSETLLESELFGHVRGAFTGAVTEKKGVFEQAQGGTCFLDEIGDIGPSMQAKLLRVLQEEETKRVGGQQWLTVDARVIAATNKDLAVLVQKGTFRQDLYYRLKVVTIALPPLRERREDIPLLAHRFLNRYNRESGKTVTMISEEATEMLCAYSWPGNVRELENAVERAVALSNQPILMPTDLPTDVRNGTVPNPAATEHSAFADTPTLEEIKKRYVLYVLEYTQGDVSRTAEILDVDRRSLYRMLDRYGITVPHRE